MSTTRDPEPNNLFKPKLSHTPCEAMFKAAGCEVISQYENQLLLVCHCQDRQQKHAEVKHCSRPQLYTIFLCGQ